MPDPLATPDDLAARLGVTFTTMQETRATALLADASAVVRNYTRQLITEATDTATLEATTEQWLYLPERPVTAVSSVLAGAAPLSAGMWFLQGDALFRYDGWNSRFYGSTSVWNQPNTIVVTYTHGYATVPDDIVRVVCKLALSAWPTTPDGTRKRSYSLDSLSVNLATDSVDPGCLDADDMRILDFYRLLRRSVRLSAEIL